MKKDIAYYLSLPYTIELLPEQPEGWVARVKELPGCITSADTPEEALAEIQELKQEWLQNAIEDHFEIPEPREEEEYSGKFNLRVPKTLHRKLVEKANEEGVSLNTLCISLLSERLAQSKHIEMARDFSLLKQSLENSQTSTKALITVPQEVPALIARLLGERGPKTPSPRFGQDFPEQIEEYEERKTETVITRRVRPSPSMRSIQSDLDNNLNVTNELLQLRNMK